MSDAYAKIVTFDLHGTRPMLLHNGRLADPMDTHATQLAAVSAKRKKTDEDHVEMLRLESRGGAYETEDGLLGMPALNIWRSFFDAAKGFKRGKDIERALLPPADDTVPLLIDGATRNVEEYLSDLDNIYRCSVRVQQNRVMRCRPIVRDWSLRCQMELLTDVINPHDMLPILERAGRLVGLGDWRPRFGRYECEMS
jgi:hypothetical protein